MPKPEKPVILFIEDEERHFQQIAHHLLGYHCVRLGVRELNQAGQRGKELSPVAAVVDLMLYTGSLEEIHRETKTFVEWFEDYVMRGQRRPPPSPARRAEVLSGADSIVQLKQACPGIRIILCSQLLAGYAGATAIAKDLDDGNNVRNAAEIAAAIRQALA